MKLKQVTTTIFDGEIPEDFPHDEQVHSSLGCLECLPDRKKFNMNP